ASIVGVLLRPADQGSATGILPDGATRTKAQSAELACAPPPVHADGASLLQMPAPTARSCVRASPGDQRDPSCWDRTSGCRRRRRRGKDDSRERTGGGRAWTRADRPPLHG